MNQATPSLAERIGHDRINQVVHAFYQELLTDPRLGPFFETVDDFTTHEQRISDFWWQAMGGELETPTEPKINMIGKHFPLGIGQEDLERWLVIFGKILGENLDEELASLWMDKALQIGARLKQIIIDHQPPGIPLGKNAQ